MEEDSPLIADASRDPATTRWLDDEPVTVESLRGAPERAREKWRSGKAAPFVIADRVSNRAIGLLNLTVADDDEVAGLAVSVFPDARGRGVASTALRLAATWSLRDLGIQRVFAEAAAENEASIRAIEKAGFRREGVLRAHCKSAGGRHDCVMFSLLPTDLSDG